jgi:hypothetical protein
MKVQERESWSDQTSKLGLKKKKKGVLPYNIHGVVPVGLREKSKHSEKAWAVGNAHPTCRASIEGVLR